jgi:hypothetical protein
MGKGDLFSELDVYLQEQQRGRKRSLSEIEKVGTAGALKRCRDLARQVQAGGRANLVSRDPAAVTVRPKLNRGGRQTHIPEEFGGVP